MKITNFKNEESIHSTGVVHIMHNMTMTQLSLSIYIELNYDAKCSTDDPCVCLPLKSCGIILEKNRET
jgi:hypothetical protein